jgi:hypothetical protein
MSQLVITNNITLDGVMESPKSWAPPYADEVMAGVMVPEGSPFAKLRLVDSVTTTTGVVIGSFRAES